MEVGGEGDYIPIATLSPPETHFNVSLLVRDKSEDSVHRSHTAYTAFEEKGDPKRIRTEVALLTSLTPYR